MTDLIAEFSPPNSAKRFTLTAASNVDLTTAVTQFRFDLPTQYVFKQLRLRQMNNIDVSHDPKLTASDVTAALKEMQKQELIKYNLQDHYDCIYLAKASLSKTRLKNAFNGISYTEIKLNDTYLYLLEQPVTQSIANNAKQQTKKTAVPLNEVQDFGELQKRALKLEKAYQDLAAGADTYQNIMHHALEDNELLTKQKEDLLLSKKEHEKRQDKMQRFLNLYYARYLVDDQHKITFLQNLLANLNSPQVQKIIQGKPENLWHFVKAVCDYDSAYQIKAD